MNIEPSRLPREPALDEKYRKLKKKFAGLALEHRKLLNDYERSADEIETLTAELAFLKGKLTEVLKKAGFELTEPDFVE